MKKLLITGGMGYIASHTNIECCANNYELALVDNFANSCLTSARRVGQIVRKPIYAYEVDLRDKKLLEEVLRMEKVDAVLHFAALKAVGESVEKPLDYYNNNISGSIALFEAMKKFNIKNIVFSSSATVYGDPEKIPVSENAKIQATNPYGQTKAMMEQILMDTAKAEGWNAVILRYFNPVGAHESGMIGEDPKYPNNLLPFISQVAAGKRKEVVVFGNDWPTPDGTGVRDYIHVVDLAKAHVRALEYLKKNTGTHIFNVGTGRGYSVLEMIKTFESVCGHKIPYKIGPRRKGDVAEILADPSLAIEKMGWKAEHNLMDMVSSAWKWQSMNPNGYEE